MAATADEGGRRLPSGLAVDAVTDAGHDARPLQHATRSCPILVSSEAGISQAPRQDTGRTDVERGANVPPCGLRALAG